MAEGGFDPPNGDGFDDGNPFSFQKFVKGKPTNTGEEKSSGETPEQPQRTRREENPFSFKQFLKKETPNKPKVYSLMVDDISETSQDSRQPKTTVNNDEHNSFRLTSSLDVHLPVINQVEHSFPDLTSDDRLGAPDEHSNVSQNENHVSVNLDLQSRNDSENNQDVNAIPHSLPDFLSDGPMLNHLPPSDEDRASVDSTSQAECPYCRSMQSSNAKRQNTELEELRRMHSVALQELDNARALADSATSKIFKLEKKVEVLQSKEADETASLENMVHQVEKNLQLTTQRAVNAENNVLKLKQEIKTFQTKVKFLTTENELLKVGAQATVTPEEVRSKTSNLSTMLNCAAGEAETSLKQLLRGVDHLRFLATVAQNIDKVTDVTMTDEK
ncbi:Serologically defined colon cancer antigen 3 [Nymphon striatum]|nr:Serologically defined colon cancer antigen 3 [Nymphon striatum]